MFISLFKLLFLIMPLVCQNLNPSKYGPYQADWTNFRMCDGSRSQNVTHNVFTLTKSPQNLYIFFLNVTFLLRSPVEELKTDVYTENKTLLYNYRVKNICKHFALGPIMRQALHADSQCVVQKGNYIIKVNISEMVTKFLGPKFFYGTFLFKHSILSKKGNVFCCTEEIAFTRKII